MMEPYSERVDAYIEKSKDFAKPILTHLRKLVHEASPDFTETIKWGAPFFDCKGPVCHMMAFKEHCGFGFWQGGNMDDPDQILKLEDQNAGSIGKITRMEDLPADEILIKYIRQALALSKAGVKAPFRAKKATNTAELLVPDYFLEALASNINAAEHFEKFSPSQKKEYVTWLEEAKSEVTRMKRLESAIEWISEGKSRHWKYK